jgi:hypothetical protein
MKLLVVRFAMLAMLTVFGIVFYQTPTMAGKEVSGTSSETQCKCYCGGSSWSPGSTACYSGFKYRCVDRGGKGNNCGWDPVKSGSEPIRCGGGEHCK